MALRVGKRLTTRVEAARPGPHRRPAPLDSPNPDRAQVEAREGGGQPSSPRSPKGGHTSHARGDLSTGEKAVVRCRGLEGGRGLGACA